MCHCSRLVRTPLISRNARIGHLSLHPSAPHHTDLYGPQSSSHGGASRPTAVVDRLDSLDGHLDARPVLWTTAALPASDMPPPWQRSASAWAWRRARARGRAPPPPRRSPARCGASSSVSSEGHAPACMPSTKALRLKLLWSMSSYSSAGSFASPSMRSASSLPLKSLPLLDVQRLQPGAAPSRQSCCPRQRRPRPAPRQSSCCR